MGLATDTAGSGFAKLATLGAGVLAVGLVAVGVKAAEMAGNFQQAVNRLRTGAGDTQDSFKTLASGILGVSVATGQLTGPLNQAMYEILSSGQRGAQAFSTLTAAAKGAVIEQANVKDVADTLSGTMTNFGTKVFGANAYMNGLITAVSLGKVTLQELSTAMGPIEPVAHAMGVSFADLSAAMSVQTNATIPATRAATGLRFMLQALEVPTKKAKDAMKEFGLNSVTVGNEMKKSLPDALQMIYNAAKKAGPEGSVPFNRAISDMIGGQRSLGAFLALTGGHMKDFRADAQKISGAMKTGAGDVQGWALVQGNFNTQMSQAKASIQAAAIGLGLMLLPALGHLAGLVPTVVGYISNFSAHSQVLVPILAGIGAILLAVLVPAVWSLAAGVLAATWPLLLIGVAVAGLVAIFMHLYQTSAPFKAFIDNLVAGLKQLWQWVQANVIPALQHFGQMAMQAGAFLLNNLVPAVIAVANWVRTGLWPVLQQIGQFLASIFMPVWQQLVSVWQGQILPALKQLWGALQPLMPVLAAIGGIILGVVVIAFGILVGLLAGIVKGLAGFLSGLAVVIGGVVQVFTGIVQIISGIVTLIYDIVTGHFDKLGADLGMIWQGILNVVSGVWNIIVGIFMSAWGLISGIVSGFVQGIIGFFTMLYNALVGHSIVPDMINGIVNFFMGLPGRVIAFVQALVTSVIALFLQLALRAIQAASQLVSGVINFFSQLPGRAGAFVSSLVTTVINFFLRMAQQAIQQASSLVSQVVGFFSQLPGRAIGAVSGLRGMLSGFLSSLVGIALSGGANIVNGIANGIRGAIGNVAGAIGGVVNFIASHLPHSPAKLGPLRDLPLQAAMITQQIAEGLAAGSPKIQAAMGSLLKPVSMNVSGSFSGVPARYSFPLSGSSTGQTVVVQAPDIYLDGWKLTDRLMPHLARKFRNGGGIGL